MFWYDMSIELIKEFNLFYTHKYFTWNDAPTSVVENLCKQYSSSFYLTTTGDLITACTLFYTLKLNLYVKVQV
jgi:hypothetical protein